MINNENEKITKLEALKAVLIGMAICPLFFGLIKLIMVIGSEFSYIVK